MSDIKGYRSFTDLRREMRGSASWSNHIDEIADSVGRVETEDKKHNHALFDNYEDFEEDDE